MSLNDKYRPTTFEEISGQSHVISFFKNLLINPEKYPHSFILAGAYGTGKTSVARIFAKELEKRNKVHYMEYDLSVVGNKDSLKEIKFTIDNIFKFSKDYRVIVFDEIQEASQQSQALFMKTLEDNFTDGQIRNIYFLFLTTNSSKIIDTIISRSIELNFYLIDDEKIREKLKYIVEKEKIDIPNNIIDKIIEYSEGHMRDAIKLLDKYLISDNKDFDSIICNTQELLKNYIFGNESKIENIIIYPVNILIRDLNLVIEKFLDKNIDNNYIQVLKIVELYFKYKNYVQRIEDFIYVIKILKTFWLREVNKDLKS